jgi:predicted nucleotidyltransferase
MKSVGIICEYNPFHNGHLYHLNKVRQMFPDHSIIMVLGGHFLQRGEPSIINKWDKTKIALEYGVDLVVELPFAFATQSADTFAKGAIQLLKSLNVSYLVFGSESNDVEKLTKLAKIQIDNKEYDNLVKKYLDEGVNYPTALSKALSEIDSTTVTTPNDILGITYIREIIKEKADIKALTIQRTNDYHSLELDNDIVSATSIRKALQDKLEVKNYVPEMTYEYLQSDLHFLDSYYSILKYKILTSLGNLSNYQTVDEGIENRISKYITTSMSTDELIKNIKTKRYTYNKIRRMLTHIMCNFTKDEAKSMTNISYIRILGFSKLGREYLNQNRKNITLPIITKYEKNIPMLDLEMRATSVYASILDENKKRILIEAEYKNKPIQK